MGEMPLGSCRPTVDRDANLVEALRRQEAGAAEALIAAYGDRAYRLAMRMTGNRSDAEEVVQDAFWTVVQKIETFRGDAAFGSWLYRITANCAYTKLRVRRARHHETSLDEGSVMVDKTSLDEGSVMVDEHAASLQDWSARVEDPALQFELRTVLTAALDTLPEDYRAVLVLRDVEGLSVQEVSLLRKCLGEHFSDRPPSLPASPSVSAPSPRRGEWSSGSTRPPPRPRSERRILSGRRISLSG